MSEDWKPGDLAVCVDASECKSCGHPTPLREGNAYTVDDAQYVEEERGGALYFAGLKCHSTCFGVSGWFDADRFRKVRPDQHEPCEEEFITLLNRTKRSVQA